MSGVVQVPLRCAPDQHDDLSRPLALLSKARNEPVSAKKNTDRGNQVGTFWKLINNAAMLGDMWVYGWVTAEGPEVSFGSDENVLKLTVVMITQCYEHTKTHQIIHCKWVSYMVCEFSLHEAVTHIHTMQPQGTVIWGRWAHLPPLGTSPNLPPNPVREK